MTEIKANGLALILGSLGGYIIPCAVSYEQNFGLSGRQLDVLADVAAGYTNREFGDHFGLGELNVKYYLFMVADKLGLSTRAELELLRSGLMPCPTCGGPIGQHSKKQLQECFRKRSEQSALWGPGLRGLLL